VVPFDRPWVPFEALCPSGWRLITSGSYR